jgi:hypothetical protein
LWNISCSKIIGEILGARELTSWPTFKQSNQLGCSAPSSISGR